MHMNIGMHDNELRMAHEDADNELHERQALHRRLGDLEVKCAKLEQETFEMEAIVEVSTFHFVIAQLRVYGGIEKPHGFGCVSRQDE